GAGGAVLFHVGLFATRGDQAGGCLLGGAMAFAQRPCKADLPEEEIEDHAQDGQDEEHEYPGNAGGGVEIGTRQGPQRDRDEDEETRKCEKRSHEAPSRLASGQLTGASPTASAS